MDEIDGGGSEGDAVSEQRSPSPVRPKLHDIETPVLT